jgi:sugar phosphate isomerase/epimerase
VRHGIATAAAGAGFDGVELFEPDLTESRLSPGQGAFDLVDFTNRLLRTGYEGPLSLEVFSDALRQADPGRVARDARRSLVALEDQLRPPALAGRHDIVRKRGRW